ncbi:hypothetical protein [Streptomyces clavifer]|nr:hypothetical protein [Streptomyces clavifer]
MTSAFTGLSGSIARDLASSTPTANGSRVTASAVPAVVRFWMRGCR